jgi:hypothetical protein
MGMMELLIVDDFLGIVIEPEGLDREALPARRASIALYRSESRGIVHPCGLPPSGALRNAMVLARAVRAERWLYP